ncbi:hypothetical protein M408DRAFT_25886 [Serendipita vermifera MAFF 305830]|uniref:Uncharacterized protein n=1 Tax=Serendipita vermifera MAFF 305830 TaxID=933852 RepID=A0A0C2X972_SERVB|nr:hypothetical protein M408DRAFT_25886 [Serendipita vermifera MAFF 305830]
MAPINPWQSTIAQQWREPQDIFSLLLIIGGEIVQKSIAQLAGGPYPLTPVAFSFGWVSYSILAVMNVLGNGTLMPEPDTQCMLVNVRKGWIRQNYSWVLARILRDWREETEDARNSLEVSICSASRQKARIPYPDLVWNLGVLVIVVQIGIALIPALVDDTWSILLLTIVGTMLSLGQASLPQWAMEKWSCRENQSDKVILLTQGNGSRRVVVIFSRKNAGLDLEDLANPRTGKLASTLPLTLFFCVSWLVLLLTATGLRTHAWYLIGISGLGTAHNVYAVGARRPPSAFGLHFNREEFIRPGGHVANKVMAVIQETERRWPGQRLGLSLMEVFFPGNGGMHPSELKWKLENERMYAECEPPIDGVAAHCIHPVEQEWRRGEVEKCRGIPDLGPVGLPH